MSEDPYRESIEEAPLEKPASSESASSNDDEIARLERILAEKRAAKGLGKEKIQAEKLTETYRASSVSSAPVSDAPAAAPSQQDIQAKVLQMKNLDTENQLKRLVELAFQKNLKEAIAVVKKLDNAYLIDQFHDVMIDQFRKDLLEQKKIEEI